MNEERDLMGELGGLQSNISTLFESIINERNKYKLENERSIASVESLMTEIAVLRKENEQLRRSNNGINLCMACSELKEQLMLQKSRSKELEKNVDILRQMVCNVPCNKGNSTFSTSSESDKKDTKSNCSLTGTESNLKTVKEEDELIIYDTFYEKTIPTNSKGFHVKNNEENDNPVKNEVWTEASYLGTCANSKARLELMDAEFRTPKKGDKSEMDFIDSPFLGVKKGAKSPILVDQRPSVNRNAFPCSPNFLKRKASESVRCSPLKHGNKTLLKKSPKQKKYTMSPSKGSRNKSASQLKSTNSIEAEISLSGVRKLKQTQLNPDFYQRKTNDSGSTSKCDSIPQSTDKNKFLDDDLILESPKHSAKYFEEFKKTFKREVSEETMTSPDGEQATMQAFDPEETFVSSAFIRESLKNVRVPEREREPSPRERSPEYNTVQYPYKGSPVRKKAERMRLPGQTCMECNKYYKAILGEINPEKLQEILNKCSRHRDQHYNVVDTPPGYWKPYLTATMDDDDTHID